MSIDAERAGHDQAARADDAAGMGHGEPGPFDRAVLALLFDHPGHQEDVVIFTDGHEDHKQEECDGPVQTDPGRAAVSSARKRRSVTPSDARYPSTTVAIK